MSKIKGYKGIGMEGRIAAWYAKNTRKDLSEFQKLATRLAEETPVNSRILEVAPGPGYLSIELAKRCCYEITGLDISETFVKIAQENARQESVAVDFRRGNASEMPFPDAAFDLIACRAAFKNFSEPVRAIDEMFRVLKTGGRAIIIDLRRDASLDEIDTYIKKSDLSRINALIYKATFRFLLIPRAYTKERFREMAARSAFGGCEILGSGIGFEIILKK
jgi:ubiquinone/menaquinone biosynthesis C-methylase UbiE